MAKYNDVIDLYEKYHYIGAGVAKFYIGCYYDNKLIACASIKKPTRQSSGDWEISRMVCNYNYKVHGLWSYILKWITNNKLISGKLITFSDNRLFNGKVYNKMGFCKDKDIKPDYYWTDNNKRYHKSALRKTNVEKKTGLTEIQLRHNQGFKRIFDYGKIKWSMVI